MNQILNATIYAAPETLSKLSGAVLQQFLSPRIILLDEPVDDADLAEAIIGSPSGQKLVERAVDKAVAAWMAKNDAVMRRKVESGLKHGEKQ